MKRGRTGVASFGYCCVTGLRNPETVDARVSIIPSGFPAWLLALRFRRKHPVQWGENVSNGTDKTRYFRLAGYNVMWPENLLGGSRAADGYGAGNGLNNPDRKRP